MKKDIKVALMILIILILIIVTACTTIVPIILSVIHRSYGYLLIWLANIIVLPADSIIVMFLDTVEFKDDEDAEKKEID